MVQHVLLMLVAAPLLALAAPITLVLRPELPARRAVAGSSRSSTRASSRFLAHPIVAWVMFA
jgi:cytochrome c oxidase assembly factor CtaG